MFLQVMTVQLSPDTPPPPPTPWGFMDYLELGIVAFVVIWIVSLLIRPNLALKNLYHHFADLQIPPKEVYEQIIAEVKKREMPGVSFAYEQYWEAGIFSSRREFLCISYKKFVLDVCCHKFGTGYYISWWLGKEDPGIFSRIPILNSLLGLNPNYQSYYQLDTATMFQSGVHYAIMSIIDEITSAKGLRQLSEFERQPRLGKM